jgi:hypothetical protein
VDDNLLRDCDYTDLILWLVDSLARKFAEWNMPLDTGLVDDVVGWFAEKTIEKVESVKTELTVEAEAKGEAKAGFYWLSLKLLARVKSALVGSVKWTPLFGPKNAEFKLGFQVLSGLVVCCFIALR